MTAAEVPHRSRAGDAGPLWWERADPQWDPAFTDDQWPTRSHRAARPVDPATVTARLADPSRAATAAAVVAALGAWRHLTTQQLAVIAAAHPNTVTAALRDLAAVGVTQLAVRPQHAPDVWRLAPDRAAVNRYLDRLDPNTARTVTVGGDPGLGRRGAHRHDLVAAEIGLRLVELRGDLTVFGETHATAAALLGDPDAHRAWAADLCVVRGDGLRVAVEIVGQSTTAQLADKITRWGRALAGWSHHRTGLVVVFVNAAAGHHNDLTSRLKTAHRQALTPNTLARHGAAATVEQVNNARSQILIADLCDWWPAARVCSPGFVGGDAFYTPDGEEWLPVKALTNSSRGIPFDPPDPAVFAYPAEAAARLAATPRWA